MTNHLKLIQQFIRERRKLEDIPESGLPFVTISRESGAGGHLLSHVILTDFLKEESDLFRGWHVFDKLLCEVVAEDPELTNSMETLLREQYKSDFTDILESFMAGYSSQYSLYKKTFRVIAMLAAIGKVIIVGRASNFVTRHLQTGIHLRLVAPEEQRVVWIAKRWKLSRDEARRTARRDDADRRRLVRTFFHADIEDPLNYDAVWNTGAADMHEISFSVIQMIKRRSGGGEGG